MIERKCKGCGAIIQTTDPKKEGYAPLADQLYCQRCFRMIHYNELPKIVATKEDYEKVIDSVLKRKVLIVFIMDVFSFKSTFHPNMIEKLKDKDVIVVANKFDLLPKSTQKERVVEWIFEQCKKVSLNPLAIGLVSATKGDEIDPLLNIIDAARNNRSVVFMGCANVGKSSLINAILRRCRLTVDTPLATSAIPGTTLKEIQIPFYDDNSFLIDTPGYIAKEDRLNELLPKSYAWLQPKKELKPVTYQLISGQTIFIGGLACLSLEGQEKIYLTAYVSMQVVLHRCPTERKEAFFQKHLGSLLIPPIKEEVSNLSYDTKELSIPKKKMLWLSGVGFILFHTDCKITLTKLSDMEVYITDAIIGSNSKKSTR